MIKFISSITSIGLESAPEGIKSATVVSAGKTPTLTKLQTLQPESDDVKRLYIGHPITSTALDGKDVLIRYMQMPVTKEKDIEEALAFQAEPLLPFPVEEALLSYQILSKNPEGSELILFAVRKDSVEAQLALWKEKQIEPERIACIQAALCNFGNTYLARPNPCLILHLQRQGMTGILMHEGKIFASFALTEGLEALLRAQNLPKNEEGWNNSGESIKKLQKEIAKMVYALAKEAKGLSIEGIFLTGECVQHEGLSQILVQTLPYPLLKCESNGEWQSQELLLYAVPIGLALGSLPGQSAVVDFRQQELRYPHPWKRLVGPVSAYFAAILLLCGAFYFFGQHYIHYKEDQLRQNYIDLLAGMHKSHDQFEVAFLAKNPKAHESYEGEIPRIEQISQDELRERLMFLQKELQASPDSFPLYANIPRVTDVLAWLTKHPTVIAADEKGSPEVRLQIDSFNYTMVKRPQQGKKQDKYQVKIELEFSSPTPKWAREFHDALIAPNDWVDPKGEVKWNTNRGKYKTSFFLKDKTVYPSG